MTIDNLNHEELLTVVKQMILDTFESIIKLNTKAADLVLKNPTPEAILAHNKQLMNLIHILYPVREQVRKIVMECFPEYEYLLDFVEKTIKSIEEK